MSDRDISYAFARPEAHGIAIVCGRISGNFEGFDADTKYDLSGTLRDDLYSAIDNLNADLLPRLVIASSRSSGIHFYYRCAEVGRSQILARRSATHGELLCHPNRPMRTLLETRSTGGIIIVPPTTGYQFLQKDMRDIPTIAIEDRKLLIEAGRKFNLYEETPKKPMGIAKSKCEYPELSPFYSYNMTDEVIHCLEKHGWIPVRRVGPRTYFRRPGETDKDTSGDFHHDFKKFKVFTTNAPEFIPGYPYQPYAVFAILECNGDYHLAAKKLLAAGYGVAYKDRRYDTLTTKTSFRKK